MNGKHLPLHDGAFRALVQGKLAEKADLHNAVAISFQDCLGDRLFVDKSS